MATIAYCTNCKANFTDKDEVASIFSGPPHHCLGCATFAKENPPADDAPSSEALVNAAPQSRDVYGAGQGQGSAATPEDADDGASLEHVEGDLLVKPVDPPAEPASEPEPEPAAA